MSKPAPPALERITNPLVDVNPHIGLWSPIGTLERAAAALELFSNLIATNDGSSSVLDNEDARFAIQLHLDSVSQAIRAVAESLASEARKPDPLGEDCNSGAGSGRP